MLFETFRVCGDSNCSRELVVTQMYVEVGVAEVAAFRVAVLEERYVMGAEFDDGSRTGLVKDCQYFSSFVRADTGTGSFTGANGCTSAAMAIVVL